MYNSIQITKMKTKEENAVEELIRDPSRYIDLSLNSSKKIQIMLLSFILDYIEITDVDIVQYFEKVGGHQDYSLEEHFFKRDVGIELAKQLPIEIRIDFKSMVNCDSLEENNNLIIKYNLKEEEYSKLNKTFQLFLNYETIIEWIEINSKNK